MQVTLPTGTTFILVIDTDSYSGNFERQLAGYATGIHDVERGHGGDEAEDAAKADPEMVGRLLAKSTTVQHAEYGRVTNTIRATPGRVNNGMGVHHDADDPSYTGTRWPAYESLAIFFGRPLDEEEMAFVRRRAHEYASSASMRKREGFAIRDVYQIEAVVNAPTEHRLG